MTSVMIFGTFDILHPGHINLFNQARKHGDDLIIVVARDETVKKIKGYLPSLSEVDRKRNLEQFDKGFKVVLGDLDDPYTAIKEYKPDIICLGYDQEAFVSELKHVLKENEINAKVVRLKPYKEDMYKSYLIKNRIKTKSFDMSRQLEAEMKEQMESVKKERQKESAGKTNKADIKEEKPFSEEDNHMK